MLKKFDQRRLRLLVILIFASALFYVSFQYFWLADFPIGDDVINHVSMAKSLITDGFGAFFRSSLYPLSTTAYVLEHKFLSPLFGFSIEKSFIFLLCLNLFIVAALAGFLSYRIFGDVKAAALTSFILASSRWLNESLRMGVMAETFGWVVFVLCLILLIEKRWPWFALSAIILLFFHPLPFGILCLTTAVYMFYWYFVGSARKQKLALILAVIGLAALAGLYLYLPELFVRIIGILSVRTQLQGERDLINYTTDLEIRRSLTYLLAAAGAITLVFKKGKSEKMTLFLIFAIFSFLICFKQWIGIHFLGSRFVFYYELANAILAAYGLVQLSKAVFNRYAIYVFVPIVIGLTSVNTTINKKLIVWQTTDFVAGGMMSTGDRRMMDRIIELIEPKDAKVYSYSLWAKWLWLRGVNVSYGGYKEYTQPYDYPDLGLLRDSGYRYLYFSAVEPRRVEIEESKLLDLVIDKESVRLYEFKKQKNRR